MRCLNTGGNQSLPGERIEAKPQFGLSIAIARDPKEPERGREGEIGFEVDRQIKLDAEYAIVSVCCRVANSGGYGWRL